MFAKAEFLFRCPIVNGRVANWRFPFARKYRNGTTAAISGITSCPDPRYKDHIAPLANNNGIYRCSI